MTVFLFLRRLWPVQMVSLPPRPLIVVRFTSPLSGFRSQQARTRFSSSGTAFRLPHSIRWLSSASYREAPGLHGDGTHSCDSPLGSAPLVFGPGPALAGSSSDPTVPSRPPALDSVSSSLPRSQLAQASCLATLQRFPKAAGFSSAIAEQFSLAHRPSSRAVYQVRWSIYHWWCHSIVHSIFIPTFAMLARSCVTYGPPRALVCPPCVVTVRFYLRFSVFTFHPCLRIRCFGFCYAPSNSLQRSVCYVPILGTCLWRCLSSLTGLCAFVSGLLPRSPADDIVFAGSCHCQNGLGSYRVSLPLSPLWLGMNAFLTSRSWSPSRSRSPVPSLAPSW